MEGYKRDLGAKVGNQKTVKPIAVTEEPNYQPSRNAEEPNPHSSPNAVHVGTTNGDRNKEETIVLTGESEAALIVVDDVVATRQPVVESNDSSDASDSILSPTVGGIAMMESSFIELDELIATTNIPSPTSTAVSRKRSVTQPNERTRSRGVTWGENGYDEGESSKEIHAIKRLKHSEGANAAEVDKSNEMLRTARVEKATKSCRGTMRRDVPFSSRAACSLCIPLCSHKLLPTDRDVVLQFAVDRLKVKYYHVYMWRFHGWKLNRQALLQLVYSIARQMRRDNESQWLKLMLHTTRETLLSLDGDVGAVTDAAVEEAMSETCRHYDNHPVAGLHWIESLQLHVAFFSFDENTDPLGSLRQKLPSGYLVHRFDPTDIDDAYSTSKPTRSEREREFWNVYQWIRSRVECHRVHVFPGEDLLCRDDGSVESVSDRIRVQVNSCPLRRGQSHLVFIRPTREGLVLRDAFVQRVVSHAVGELLTLLHSVYIVTDVVNATMLSDVSSLIDETCVDMQIYCGLKQRFAPVSVVVIRLSFRPR